MSGGFKMRLKALSVVFKDLDRAVLEIHEAVEKGKKLVDQSDVLNFDSPKTWRNFMSSQKLEILTAVSRQKPSSIYQLAKSLGRPTQHVLKDCRELEAFNFIELIESKDARRSLRPELSFEYDFIRVESPVQTSLPISEKAMRLLDQAASA
jgi:predicted transcriptional regulator